MLNVATGLPEIPEADWFAAKHAPQVEIEIGLSLIPYVSDDQFPVANATIGLYRNAISRMTGIVLPTVNTRDNLQLLSENQYSILADGIRITTVDVACADLSMIEIGPRKFVSASPVVQVPVG